MGRVGMNPFERMVAFRYLRARRQEGFVSVIAVFSLLGIMLGVATLIIVMAVMNGFRADLLGRILGFNGHITVYAAPGAPLNDFDQIAAKIKAVPGVTAAYPEIEGQVMATSRDQSSGVLVRGVSAETLAAQSEIAKSLSSGALVGFKDGGIVIGQRLAFKLGVKPGDTVTLISPQGTPTAFGTMPRIKAYRIAGTFNVGMYEFDSGVIFMPMPAAQIFFQLPNAVSDISVFVAKPDDVRAYDQAVSAALGNRMRIFDWQQSNLSFFNAVEIERNVMFLILTLIIVVAAFNVISSMIMLVKDKGRDIAILRTMGATRGMILRIFMLAGASIGVVGTALGFVLGVEFAAHIEAIREFIQGIIGTNLFAPEIYFLTQLPARIDPYEVGSVVGMALALSFLATIYPSWRAARLDPVEALRYE
ncbi:MAG: lipoprotein-releasing ABC transporter permease subunit [Alphaproteobacteria bacterium]|nr:lipoprotein-releasing ABC transporter permease subunit [Alphaproteobacteria bacterium]